MRSAFSGAADFSGIDNRRDLQLSEVVHKAFTWTSRRKGTEAAAATGAAVALGQKPPEPVFRADHPFLFFIRDIRSGLTLFTVT